jgi:hypothetical protein
VEEELIDHSPAAHIRCPRVDYESHAVALDRNELGALLAAAGLGPPAGAALDGLLDGAALRALGPGQAIQHVQQVNGLGSFAAELVVVRGANAPDALPGHERRLDAEIAERYGPGRTLADVSQAWRPYRTWAAVHLRALREQRTGEISGR